jgi:hypothetical protein
MATPSEQALAAAPLAVSKSMAANRTEHPSRNFSLPTASTFQQLKQRGLVEYGHAKLLRLFEL